MVLKENCNHSLYRGQNLSKIEVIDHGVIVLHIFITYSYLLQTVISMECKYYIFKRCQSFVCNDISFLETLRNLNFKDESYKSRSEQLI